MSSKATYWKLTTPLPFKSIPDAIDALQILEIESITREGLAIAFFEGREIADKSVVLSIDNLSGQRKLFEWKDASFMSSKNIKLADAALATPGVTRDDDQWAGYYAALGASRPEYAGTLIVQDLP